MSKNVDKTLNQKKEKSFYKHLFEDLEFGKRLKANFLYSLRKFKKHFLILGFATLFISSAFIFVWRTDSMGVILPHLLFLNVYAFIFLFISPIFYASISSKSYIQEKESGEIVFLITKRTSKYEVYFSKLLASYFVALLWNLLFLFCTMFWMGMKVLIVDLSISLNPGGSNSTLSILGYNPSLAQFNDVMKVLWFMQLPFALIALFWIGLFFILSRWVGSRGLFASAFGFVVFSNILPIITNAIAGFTWGITLEKGKYSVIEHLDVEYSCYIRPSNENPINTPDSNDIKRYNAIPTNSLSTWDAQNFYHLENNNYEFVSNQSYIDYCNNKDFIIDPNNPVWTEWDQVVFGQSNFSSSTAYAYSIGEDQSGNPSWKTTRFPLLAEQLSLSNSFGWLTFLSPTYYFAVLMEQTFVVSPMIQNYTLFPKNMLSSSNGTNKYDYKFTSTNPSQGAMMTFNRQINQIEGITFTPTHREYYEVVDLELHKINSSGINLTSNTGVLEYNGLVYWMPPITVILFLIFSSFTLAGVGVYLISNHDITR